MRYLFIFSFSQWCVSATSIYIAFLFLRFVDIFKKTNKQTNKKRNTNMVLLLLLLFFFDLLFSLLYFSLTDAWMESVPTAL